MIAVDLLRNYGQHHANLAGLRETTGDFVITMDDDGQNPPDQVPLLVGTAMQGHDVVFGAFERKQAAGYRRLGSRLIGLVNRRVFGQPDDLVVSNFRVLRRDVVDRICSSRTAHPYLTGQALLYSGNRANVSVRHEPRAVGASTYSFPRILALVLTILFSYSSWPLRTLALIGFGVAALSFVLGGVYLVLGLLTETRVEGWTTLVVLLAVFNGFTIGLLSMLGEYVVRTLNAVSAQDTLPRPAPGLPVTDYFLVVGAQRCGTTYLRTLLDEHPVDRDGHAARSPSPRSSSTTRSSAVVWSGTTPPGSPARPPGRCAARSPPATSRCRRRSTGCAPCSAPRGSSCSCATRWLARSPTGS